MVRKPPLIIRRGEIHDYLGMLIDFETKGKVKIDMRKYIDSILVDLPEEYTRSAITPAADHLFDTNEECKKLDEVEGGKFRTIVAKILCLCKRGRPDIQNSTVFLTTRVKEPDMDDKKKLQRVIWYLRGSRDLVITLESDDSGTIKWWVDASFAVHNDYRSHTCETMSL